MYLGSGIGDKNKNYLRYVLFWRTLLLSLVVEIGRVSCPPAACLRRYRGYFSSQPIFGQTFIFLILSGFYTFCNLYVAYNISHTISNDTGIILSSLFQLHAGQICNFKCHFLGKGKHNSSPSFSKVLIGIIWSLIDLMRVLTLSIHPRQ